MKVLAPWFELRLGQGCPLCAPRPRANHFAYFVCALGVSSLYLARNQTYRGTCAVVYDPAHVTRPSELDVESWRAFCADAWSAESAVTRAFRPDHINLECLGNTVPHLHFGIIPRYRTDPRWGHPIWTEKRDTAHTSMNDDDCEQLARLLRQNLPDAVASDHCG